MDDDWWRNLQLFKCRQCLWSIEPQMWQLFYSPYPKAQGVLQNGVYRNQRFWRRQLSDLEMKGPLQSLTYSINGCIHKTSTQSSQLKFQQCQERGWWDRPLVMGLLTIDTGDTWLVFLRCMTSRELPMFYLMALPPYTHDKQ